MGEAEWVRADASLMREMGSEWWLRRLLDVLNGDIVTAEEVGLAPSGGTFGYGAPGTSNAQRQGRFQRGCRATLLGYSARLGGEAGVNKHGWDARRARLPHLPPLVAEVVIRRNNQ